jgi:PAS domain S-box-containing protein
VDEEYRSFLEHVAAIVSAAISRARSAETARQHAEELAKLDRAKTAFFSNASHEFRTPLTLMLAPLQEALAGDGAGQIMLTREEVSLIHRNGLRLLKLVNTLLDFSRIEAGRIEPRFARVDLAQVTADLASNFRSAMERAGLEFTIDCPPLTHDYYVDHDLWEKIVLNLLSNAFKFTLHGCVALRLREPESGGGVELQVSDTGVGIPEEALPRLFERFYRVEQQRGRTLEGSGIGLALVQELARVHGGSASVQSSLGQGTTISVHIPAGRKHLPPLPSETSGNRASTSTRSEAYIAEALRWLPTADEDRAEQSDTTLDTDDVSFERMRLLIVDDNADMRAYLARLFKRHELRLASDGEDAWTLIQRSAPDLVLTDVMMPRLDGFGLLARMRSDEHLRHVPLVMLSARAGEEAGTEARTAGADDYIVKPFTARELSLRVHAAWKMARVRRESFAALQRSERLFRDVADQAPVMIWLADHDGLVTYLNKSWYDFTGQTAGDAQERGWLACVHGEDRERIEKEDIEVASQRRAFRFEYRLRRRDGTYRWMLDSGVPRLDAHGNFEGFIGSVVDITEHREAEKVLRRSNLELEQQVTARTREFRTLWQLTPDILAIANHEGWFVDVNPAASNILGWSREELLAAPFSQFLHPEDQVTTAQEYAQQQSDGYSTTHFENRYRCRDGSYRCIVWTAVTAGERIYATGRDVTATKAQAEALRVAEESLRQASKMEAVGQLTGGIAHDFNNLLTVVIGNLDSVLRRTNETADQRVRRAADNAMAGARRAAALTQRLLAFARRQPLDPKPTDVSRLVLSMNDILTRTLGENIEIQTVFGAGLWRVEVDPNQLENALLNLVLNARDAMPSGGKLTIETTNALLDEHYTARASEVSPGQYVVLAVSDTGHGMTADVLARVFEPFFTTKPIGAGSGLGLPQVYGFVKQSGGHVKVYSEVDSGTTVKIYLPRIANEVVEDDTGDSATAKVPDGSAEETILVVEDESAVREYSCDILRELGYRVIEARDGSQALGLLERHPEIALLFTDVGLPGMTGRELADRARVLLPRLKVLFTTGYARNAIVHHGRLDPGVHLLVKPFTYTDLAARVRTIIDGG